MAQSGNPASYVEYLVRDSGINKCCYARGLCHPDGYIGDRPFTLLEIYLPGMNLNSIGANWLDYFNHYLGVLTLTSSTVVGRDNDIVGS